MESIPPCYFANSLCLNSLFDPTEDGKSYQLTYKSEWLDNAKVEVGSDLWALQENMASVSRLDFTELRKALPRALNLSQMLHRLFRLLYWKKRRSYGRTYRKIDGRSMDRDLVHYFHDFGDDGANSHSSNWLRKRIFKIFLVYRFGRLIWFTYMSYIGLLIYDG